MKVLNYGSLNMDYVYTVDHMIREGETQSSIKLETFCGGKGLNQSVALAKAGVPVYHAGIVGEDGDMLLKTCRDNGVNISYIKKLPVKGGHTVIQVDREGRNSIILYGGTNQMQTEKDVDRVLAGFEAGDYLLLQNEINLLDYIIDEAYTKGMRIVLNPSPCNEKLQRCDLQKISLFLLNEIEGGQMAGCPEENKILEHLAEKFPRAAFVLTLGEAGAVYYDGREKIFQNIFKVRTVDTTAAGDTFTGFFVASLICGEDVRTALCIAAKASAIAVSRPGAAPSIPTIEEVKKAVL